MRAFSVKNMSQKMSGLALVAGAMLAAAPVLAQTTAGVEANGMTTTPKAPDILPLATPQTFDLPPASQLMTGPSAYGANTPSVVLKTIKISPNRLLTQAETRRLTAPYIGVAITLADVAALRDELTQAIVRKGYINSGAVVDPQDISGGTLSITIVEGRLNRVAVKGTSYLSQDYISHRLALRDGQPLSAADLQNAFQLLLQDRNIAHLNARLVPGAKPGEAVLDVDTVEAPRASVAFFAASDRSPAVGDTRVGVRAHLARIVVPGDDLSGEAGRTAGLTDVALLYKAPLTTNDLSLNLYVQSSKAQIVSHPLNALDAISNSTYGGGGLSLPLIARPGLSLVLASNIDYMHVRTDLMGLPFSFSPGAVNGVTSYGASRTTLTYAYFSNVQSAVMNLGVARGFGGNSQATGVKRDFTYIDVSGSYVRRLNAANDRLILKGSARFTRDDLYATEMFVIGGGDSVRGYRQNALLGNSGYWVSAEYQMPLVSVLKPMRGAPGMFSPQTVTLGAFIDDGRIFSGPISPGEHRGLSAIGLHTIWAPSPHFDIDMYFAHQMQRANFGGSYEDAGFGFATHLKF